MQINVNRKIANIGEHGKLKSNVAQIIHRQRAKRKSALTDEKPQNN
jgi:hypothetical protein